MRRRRYEVTEMYALIEISNQMLEDSAFDHAGPSLRKAGLAVAINEMLALNSCRCSASQMPVRRAALRRRRRFHVACRGCERMGESD